MTTRQEVLRVLDANINRAREGLRVSEDLVRLGFGLRKPFARVHALRHRLNAAVRRLPVPQADIVASRDSLRDPGRRAVAGAVRSTEHLLLINLQRTKEALRVLEETSRLVSPGQVAQFQRLRFDTYEVERELFRALAALRHH